MQSISAACYSTKQDPTLLLSIVYTKHGVFRFSSLAFKTNNLLCACEHFFVKLLAHLGRKVVLHIGYLCHSSQNANKPCFCSNVVRFASYLCLSLFAQGVEASVNGVLGGYGHVSDRDVSASDGFLVEVLSNLSEPFLSSKNLVALGEKNCVPKAVYF